MLNCWWFYLQWLSPMREFIILNTKVMKHFWQHWWDDILKRGIKHAALFSARQFNTICPFCLLSRAVGDNICLWGEAVRVKILTNSLQSADTVRNSGSEHVFRAVLPFTAPVLRERSKKRKATSPYQNKLTWIYKQYLTVPSWKRQLRPDWIPIFFLSKAR